MQELITSYPRGAGKYFRIRQGMDDPGELVTSVSGQSIMVSTDNKNGRLHMLGNVEYSKYGGKTHAELSCEYDLNEWAVPDCIPELGYWRICFRRSGNDWRVKLEANPTSPVFYVSTYEGIIQHDWYDETPHLYHVGYFYNYDNKAMFLPGVCARPDSVAEKIGQIRAANNLVGV